MDGVTTSGTTNWHLGCRQSTPDIRPTSSHNAIREACWTIYCRSGRMSLRVLQQTTTSPRILHR